MTAGNWIADENKFGLEKPPDWWLQRLADFDHRLVLMPSRKERKAYLLGIRRLHSAGLGDVAMLDNKHPDTNMCYMHGVLPIGPLNVVGQNPFTETTINSLLDSLRRRDTWRLEGEGTGNPLSYADAVEEAEQKREAKERQDIWDSFYHRGRDAWRSMQARIGSRSRRASDHHGVAQPRKLQPVNSATNND